MLTKKDFQDALQVGDAINLSGIVHSLGDVIHKLRETGFCSSHCINTHPIVKLYAARIRELTLGCIDMHEHRVYDAWQEAVALMDTL